MDGYDDWKLAAPINSKDELEVFKSEHGEFYSTNERDIDFFDRELERLKYNYCVEATEEDAIDNHDTSEKIDEAEYSVELKREAMRGEL